MMKVLFDRTASFIAISLLLVPVFIPLWLLIISTSKGGAIYGHTRIGKDCRPFTLYKFRSMVVGADKHGYQTDANDSRITKVGKFLRKTSLDELPQLFNVLLGDMSLVGPRPDTPMQEKDYTPEQWRLRCSVRPGITGLAQIHGRSAIHPPDRIKYDLEYAAKNSFWGDILIMLKTARVITGKGVN